MKARERATQLAELRLAMDAPAAAPEPDVRRSAAQDEATQASGAPHPDGGGPAFADLDPQAQAAARKAFAYVVRSTAQHPRTEAEVRDRLHRREVDAELIGPVVEHARRQGVLDDAAFARAWVEDRGRMRGWGAARLRRELTRRGVAAALVDDALGLLAGRDDFTVATELARHRFRQLPAALEPEAAARRLQSYLVRRGHPSGLAQRVAFQVSGLDRAWD